VAMSIVFLVYNLLQARDGLLVRPHRVVWRVVTGIAVLYMMALVVVLFQNVDDARQLFKFVDSSLGKPLPDRGYADDCRVFTPNDSRGYFGNIMDTLNDEFVLAHLLGWFGKALLFRDFWLATSLSVLFEVWEVTFAHQLPNFHECWWDHIILDLILCNGLGIWLGLQVCRYLEMHQFDWVGISSIPTTRGKVVRAAQQFLPASYEHYEWRLLASPKHLLEVLLVIGVVSVVELNAFYLKTTLWLPPPHPINIVRLVIWWLMAIPAMREYYQFVSDKREKKLGTMVWLSLACVGVETLIVYKFRKGVWDEAVMPTPIKIIWTIAIIGLVTFFGVYFYNKHLQKKMKHA